MCRFETLSDRRVLAQPMIPDSGYVGFWSTAVTESNVGPAFAKQLSAQQNTITKCQQVLIQSCDTELRVAEQFCKLAEYHLRRNVEHAQELIAAAEKAVAVAAKYARDPEERKRQLAVLNERIANLTDRMKHKR